MKNKSLMFSLDIFLDGGQELVGKIAIFEKIGAILEVNDGRLGGDGGGFGFFGKLNQGIVGLGEVKIYDIRGGSALDARYFEGTRHKTGEPEGGIARGVFLIIGTFVSFVNDNKAKVMNWGKEGGAGADDNEGLRGF